ncbi:hypothetical protein FD755_009473, partial [Muntiacus reevesi]
SSSRYIWTKYCRVVVKQAKGRRNKYYCSHVLCSLLLYCLLNRHYCIRHSSLLKIVSVLNHLILRKPLCSSYFYYPYFYGYEDIFLFKLISDVSFILSSGCCTKTCPLSGTESFLHKLSQYLQLAPVDDQHWARDKSSHEPLDCYSLPVKRSLSTFNAFSLVLVLVTQLCPTLCNPMNCSPLGFSVYKIFHARILEWIIGHSLDYLTIHKYGNAARNDLWNTLSEALKRNGKYVNIQEVMDQWTLQMGYPVITILGNTTTENRIIITQQHFIYDISAKTKAHEPQNNSYLWQIPLTIVVGNRSHVSSEAIIWVSNKSEHHRITLDKGSWLLGNINQTGYFRVNYDLRNWRLLIDQLIRNHEEYILKQVATTYIKLGWPKSNFNGSLVQASYQHEIPLNVRDIVYCTGVSLLDEDVWEFIWMKFHSTTAISEKKILLEALTCSDDRNLLNRLLNLSLNSEVVLDQDAIDVIIHVARNPHGRDLAWKFFRDKWRILNTRYGEALFMNSKLISGVTEFLNTEGELKELKNFMKSYDGVAAASFSRAVETVEANVRWKMLYQDELFQWLGKALRH